MDKEALKHFAGLELLHIFLVQFDQWSNEGEDVIDEESISTRCNRWNWLCVSS
jgi:hypothetical protein